MAIRENIIKLREMNQITQEQLAEIAGVSRGAVSQWRVDSLSHVWAQSSAWLTTSTFLRATSLKMAVWTFAIALISQASSEMR